MSAALQSRASGALMVLLVLLLLVGAGVFAGVSALQAKRLELEAQQTQFDNLKRRRPAAPNPSAPPEKGITVQPFLAEENFALAANALQKRVVGLIEQANGKLVTVGVDPPITGDEELARRVSVQVSAELTNEALQKVLYQLESDAPFVFVDSFSANRTAGRDGDAKNEAQVEPQLSVSMSVTGYRRKGRK
ncbi:MAG: hypothetical protein GEU91_10385 [Rhizobiales bacterium]|nr:hypothetical protein [Hyphomicrobiales bacterium]